MASLSRVSSSSRPNSRRGSRSGLIGTHSVHPEVGPPLWAGRIEGRMRGHLGREPLLPGAGAIIAANTPRGIGALNVTVRLFASYREKIGTGSLPLDLPAEATIGALVDEIARRHPGLTDEPDGLVVAVNDEYRDHLFVLSDGDEVALIPPVSGGAPGTDRSTRGPSR